ncbi:MAG TPA: hypothetical protein PKE58_05080 [Acidobacteriota bacterium]|nr:hypothetical protein [Acidobacteriota bacterium]
MSTNQQNTVLANLPPLVQQHIKDLATSKKISIEQVIESILIEEVRKDGIEPFAQSITPQYWMPLHPGSEFTLVKVSCVYVQGHLSHKEKEPRYVKVPVEMIGSEQFVFACEISELGKSDVIRNDDFVIFKEAETFENGDLVLFAKGDTVLLLPVYRDGGWINHSRFCTKEYWKRIEEIRIIGVAIGVIRGLNPGAAESPASALQTVLRR